MALTGGRVFLSSSGLESRRPHQRDYLSQRLADARVTRIENTPHMDEMVVSIAALATMRNAERYVVADSDALAFGAGDDFAGFPPVA